MTGAAAKMPRVNAARSAISLRRTVPAPERVYDGLRQGALALGAALGVLGAASYPLQTDLLTFFPRPTPFAFNVGLAGCLLAFATARDGTREARVAAGAAMALGALVLAEWLSGRSLGIDQMFFDSMAKAPKHPGRMAPNTATCVVLIAATSLLRPRLGHALAGIAGLVALMGALGYTTSNAGSLAGLGTGVSMALPTGLLFALLSLSLVLLRERDYLLRRSVGGTLQRVMLPIGVVVPMSCGALLLTLAAHGKINEAVAVWVFTIVIILAALSTLSWVATTLDAQERRGSAGLSLQATMADNLSEGLCLRREEDGRIVSVNPALERMFGYPEGSLVGTTTRLLSDDDEQSARTALRTTGRWTADAQTRHADGSRFWCSVKAASFDHPDYGQLRVILHHDVTARRYADQRRQEAEAELRRSNAELEQFAHVASHDLSEPLRVVGGFVGLLQKRYEGRLDDDADKFIGATVSGVERMQALIDALLAYSRVGSSRLEVSEVDVEQLVAGARASLTRRLEESGGTVDCGAMPTVSADPVLLERVFQNLIANALKFTNGAAPQVRITADRQDGGWVFHVRDNGEGISPEYAEKVFGMFERLHGRDRPGTGIGLSITRRIVERHGGRIWVEPAEGGGSLFHFTLPETTNT